MVAILERTYGRRLLDAHQPRIGEHIRIARQIHGLSTGDLAERMGCQPTMGAVISMIELNTRNLTLDMLGRIADALDCTPGQLWRGEFRLHRCSSDHSDRAPHRYRVPQAVVERLTPREDDLIELMARRPGRFFTAAQLGQVLRLSDGDVRTIIFRIRSKRLPSVRIENRPRMGYRLAVPE